MVYEICSSYLLSFLHQNPGLRRCWWDASYPISRFIPDLDRQRLGSDEWMLRRRLSIWFLCFSTRRPKHIKKNSPESLVAAHVSWLYRLARISGLVGSGSLLILVHLRGWVMIQLVRSAFLHGRILLNEERLRAVCPPDRESPTNTKRHHADRESAIKVTEILIINLKFVEKENILYDRCTHIRSNGIVRISSRSVVKQVSARVTFISFYHNWLLLLFHAVVTRMVYVRESPWRSGWQPWMGGWFDGRLLSQRREGIKAG